MVNKGNYNSNITNGITWWKQIVYLFVRMHKSSSKMLAVLTELHTLLKSCKIIQKRKFIIIAHYQ